MEKMYCCSSPAKKGKAAPHCLPRKTARDLMQFGHFAVHSRFGPFSRVLFGRCPLFAHRPVEGFRSQQVFRPICGFVAALRGNACGNPGIAYKKTAAVFYLRLFCF
ncbi:MAG TPA: hypothetical protein H9745_05825 [Candidatus Agathobaculum stercoravium]|nr:hypothetical protein [Candidatus Agathobaculum stercoravium]